jgi:hypothetical protein
MPFALWIRTACAFFVSLAVGWYQSDGMPSLIGPEFLLTLNRNGLIGSSLPMPQFDTFSGSGLNSELVVEEVESNVTGEGQ